MLIGSNSNFFQQLSAASTAVATPAQGSQTAPAATTTSPEKFAGQQKSSLAQAEAGKSSSFLGKVTDLFDQIGGGDPGKKANKIRANQPLNQVKNGHQAIGELYIKFVKDTNHYADQIKEGHNTDLTPKGIEAFKTPISTDIIRFIKANPQFITEYIANPAINRDDMLQHNFHPDGKVHYSRDYTYQDLFPTEQSERAFQSWMGDMFKKDPHIKAALDEVNIDRNTNPPIKMDMLNLNELMQLQKIEEVNK